MFSQKRVSIIIMAIILGVAVLIGIYYGFMPSPVIIPSISLVQNTIEGKTIVEEKSTEVIDGISEVSEIIIDEKDKIVTMLEVNSDAKRHLQYSLRKAEEEAAEPEIIYEPEIVEMRGITFTYDKNLEEIDKENIVEQFKVFAPNDDYDKILRAMSKMALGEAGGCCPTEIAATAWNVLNRYDAGYASSIFNVISAPGQYHGYVPSYGVRKDIYDICEDVIARWVLEKEGNENVGRILPSDYFWFAGDGLHNHFRNQYRGGDRWDWSLSTPYDDRNITSVEDYIWL